MGLEVLSGPSTEDKLVGLELPAPQRTSVADAFDFEPSFDAASSAFGSPCFNAQRYSCAEITGRRGERLDKQVGYF